MILYRLAFAAYAEDLSGMGAKMHGGRWNPPGIPVVYTSENLALAVLETLANVPSEFLAQQPSLYDSVILRVPDDASVSTVAGLPENWRSFPPPPSLAAIGQLWAKEGKTLMLKVPSAVVGEGNWNYLINPLHPQAAQITIVQHTAFTFDARLIRSPTSDPIDFAGKINARRKTSG